MKDLSEQSSLSTRLLSSSLRIFFKLLYNEFAWTYDGVAAAVSLGMWKDWVQAILPYLGTSQKILELGFGPGHLQAALKLHGYDSVGLDASRYMARRAMYLSRQKNLSFVLVSGYAQLLPFSKHSFSHVLATFPSEYIIDPLALAEIWRVLIPDGQLLILPIAWITDQRLPYRLASGLFRFTGQAPPYQVQQASQHYLAPFNKAGSAVSVQEIRRPASSLLLIKANKIS